MRSVAVKTIVLGVFALLFAAASQTEAGQAYFYMGSMCPTPSELDGNAGVGHPLAVGDLIQVIYVGSNGQIDPPDASKPDYLGGDDALLVNKHVGDDDLLWGMKGAGKFTIDTNVGIDNAKVYLRAWDGSTIATASYYANTTEYQLDDGLSVPPDYYPPTFSANQPKPSGAAATAPKIAQTPTGKETPKLVETQASRLLKQAVLDDLSALRVTVRRKEDRQKFEEAVKHITKSLTPSCWIDNSRLKASEGKKVFDEDKAAVIQLLSLRDDRRSTVPPAILQDFIDRILKADRLLAAVAIAASTRNTAKANAELRKGDNELAKGRCDRAIGRFKIAWNIARPE